MQWLIALLPITLAGCASLLGVEELPGGMDAGVDAPDLISVEVRLTRDGQAADGVEIVSHGPGGEIAGGPFDIGTVSIPRGGMVSVLFETGPGQFGVRTWTDLADGDVLALELAAQESVIAETSIVFDPEVPADADGFELQLRCTGRGAFSTQPPVSVPPQDITLTSRCLNDDGTIDIVARVGTGDTASQFSVLTGLSLAEISDEDSIQMPAWTSGLGVAQFPVAGRAVEELSFQRGDYRGDHLFETTYVRVNQGFIELAFVPPFAELVAVELTNGSEDGQSEGADSSLTAFVDPVDAPGEAIVADTIDAAALDIVDLENLETTRDPRPSVAWTVSSASVELDAVLFTINLFDIASPSKTLTWDVVSPPGRERIELPEFPDGLIVGPDDFSGWSSGEVTAFASTDYQGYRSLRAGGGLTGALGRQAPRQRSAGTSRVWRESLVPP